MTPKEAVKTLVAFADGEPRDDPTREAARIVLAALRERDQVVRDCEVPILIMTRKIDQKLEEVAHAAG